MGPTVIMFSIPFSLGLLLIVEPSLNMHPLFKASSRSSAGPGKEITVSQRERERDSFWMV